MIPFDAESYLRLFSTYNAAFLPFHAAACGLGLLAVAAAIRPLRGAGRAIAAALAVFWGWTGLIFHGHEAAVLNWAAPAFGVVFGLQALLLVVIGTLLGRLRYEGPVSPRWPAVLGGVLVAIAVLGFPLLDHVTGAGWPAVRLFPVAPAPLAVFTLGVLLLARPPAPLSLFMIPLLWCAVHAAAARQLSLWVDVAAAGLAVAVSIAVLGLGRRNAARRPAGQA